jgi:hypothetical protein
LNLQDFQNAVKTRKFAVAKMLSKTRKFAIAKMLSKTRKFAVAKMLLSSTNFHHKTTLIHHFS